MKYSDYTVTRNLTWEIMIREEITKLPVMVGDLCKQMGIHICLYNRSAEHPYDGFTTRVQDVLCIFVARDCTVERQRFTAAHELGHILLGHVGKYELVNREPSARDNPIEQAANVFASRLLAPACVLWALNLHTPEEIARLCNISYQSASFRAALMEILYKRDKFLTSPFEQRVYDQFKPFILKTKIKRFWTGLE